MKRLWRKIVYIFTWRRKLCNKCRNLYIKGKTSPCRKCKRGSEYGEYKGMNERIKR